MSRSSTRRHFSSRCHASSARTPACEQVCPSRHRAQRRRLNDMTYNRVHRTPASCSNTCRTKCAASTSCASRIGDAATQALAQSGSHGAQPRRSWNTSRPIRVQRIKQPRIESEKTNAPIHVAIVTACEQAAHEAIVSATPNDKESRGAKLKVAAAAILAPRRTECAPAQHVSRGGCAIPNPELEYGMSAGQPPLDSPENRRPHPECDRGTILRVGHGQDQPIVLTRPTSLGWFIGFSIAFQPYGLDDRRIGWLIIKGAGTGPSTSHRLGFSNRQFRVVVGIVTRHADLTRFYSC